MRKILLKNSLFGLIQSIVNILLVFIVIPIFINIQGSEKYGIFAIVMIMGNLNSFTSLGLTNALVKFIAEQGKTKESDTDIVVNFMLMLAVSIPITVIAVLFNKIILLSVLNIPEIYYNESKYLYIWIIIANSLLLTGQSFKSVLDALQKVYITSVQQLVYNIVYWGLILIVLIGGYSLSMIGFVIFISAVVWFISTLLSAFRVWGRISFILCFQNQIKPSIKKQFNYSLKIYTSGMIGFFYEPLSKILISNFIGVTEVGFYDIALRLKNQIWVLISKIFYPMFPFISNQKDLKIIRKYVHDIEQKTFILIVPLIALIIVTFKPLIELWLGDENAGIISFTAISLISSHLLFSSTVIPIYQFIITKNHAGKTIFIQLINTTLNILFFFAFLPLLNFHAIIIGNIAGIFGSFMLSLYFQKKYLNSLIFQSKFQVFKLIALFSIVLITGFTLQEFFVDSIKYLFVVLPVILIQVLVLYRLLKLFTKEDISRYAGSENYLSVLLRKILC